MKTKKQIAAGPRKSAAEKIEEARAEYQRSIDRLCAYIAYRAEREPASLWADQYFPYGALIPAFWLPEDRVPPAGEDTIARGKRLGMSRVGDFYREDAHALAEIVMKNDVPDFDLEIVATVHVSDHEMAEPIRVVRSGSKYLYLNGFELMERDGPELLRHYAQDFRQQADECERVAKLGEG